MSLARFVQLTGALFVIVYALSNSTAFFQSTPLYIARHSLIVLVAIGGGVFFLHRGTVVADRRYVLFIVVVALLAAPYLARAMFTGRSSEFTVGVQYLVFAVAVVGIAVAGQRVGYRMVTGAVILILLVIGLIAAWAGLDSPMTLYNTYWGRPRLLLGFWHPKQLGTLLSSAALLAATAGFLGIARLRWFTLYVGLALLMVFVDSRNMLLFALIFAGSYLVAKYLSYFGLASLIIAGSVTAAWFIARYPLLVDIATSGRISVWSARDYTGLGSGAAFVQAGQPHGLVAIDNYFLGYFLENGIYGFLLPTLLVVLVTGLIAWTPDARWRRLKVAATIAFFFSSIFDAGMFSTGNLLNLTVWVYLLAGEGIFARVSGQERDAAGGVIEPHQLGVRLQPA